MHNPHSTRRQAGFTLVELLIVAIILAILAAIIIPQFASTTVDGSDSIVASTSAAGQYRASAISPHTLGSGQYFVGAHYFQGDDDVLVLATDTAIPGITYGSARFDTLSGSASLSFPSMSFGTSLVGGMAFTEPAAVPEPSTLVLWSLGAVGLVGLGWRRRKQAA